MPKSKDTIIVIHGTFASDETWWRPGNSFCRKLNAELQKNGEDSRCWRYLKSDFMKFQWSGKNSEFERNLAAIQLRKEIGYLCSKAKIRKIHFICHSHGGNVLAKTLEDGTGKEKIGTIVFLGTPFIKNKEYDKSTPVILYTFILISLTLVTTIIVRNIYDNIMNLFDLLYYLSLSVLLFGFVAYVFAPVSIWLYLYGYLFITNLKNSENKRPTANSVSGYQYKNLYKTNIIYSKKDEAFRLLKMAISSKEKIDEWSENLSKESHGLVIFSRSTKMRNLYHQIKNYGLLKSIGLYDELANRKNKEYFLLNSYCLTNFILMLVYVYNILNKTLLSLFILIDLVCSNVRKPIFSKIRQVAARVFFNTSINNSLGDDFYESKIENIQKNAPFYFTNQKIIELPSELDNKMLMKSYSNFEQVGKAVYSDKSYRRTDFYEMLRDVNSSMSSKKLVHSQYYQMNEVIKIIASCFCDDEYF